MHETLASIIPLKSILKKKKEKQYIKRIKKRRDKKGELSTPPLISLYFFQDGFRLLNVLS